MGKVAITFRVMPESVETDLEKIKEEIQKLNPNDIKEEPLAFGLKAIKVLLVMEDKGGVQEELKQKLDSIEGVKDAEPIDITLL